jgi:hypothetical protein
MNPLGFDTNRLMKEKIYIADNHTLSAMRPGSMAKHLVRHYYAGS